MKRKSRVLDYNNVFKYLFLLFSFLLINSIENEVMPYSTSIFVSYIFVGCSFYMTSILYLISFVLLSAPGLIASAGITIGIMLLINLIKLKFPRKNKFEYVFYTAICTLGFLFLGDTSIEIIIEKRILSSLITTLISLAFIISFNALDKKGLKYKMSTEEYLSLLICLAIFGLGLSNLFSPFVWKAISIFIILCSVYLFKFGIGLVISSCLGISLSIYYGNVNYISIFLAWGLVSQCFLSTSRYLSALSIFITDFLLNLIFNVYTFTFAYNYLPDLIGLISFCIIPTKALEKLKDKISLFREKQIIRQAINSNRLTLSNKLYELSGVFLEMAEAFNLFKKNELSLDKIKDSTCKTIKENVCKNCESYQKCQGKEKTKNIGINKLLDIGLAKEKVSLIDLPNEISKVCIHPNDIIYAINKFIAEYKSYRVSSMNISSSRALISKETEGVAEVLKGLALESGTLLKYQNNLEKILNEELLKKGFLVSEILIYGEQDRLSVGLILTMKEFSLEGLTNAISKCLKTNMILCEKNNITQEKVYLSFKKKVEYDAVFGVSKSIKDGSIVSGDTHSITRISDEKFLVALSDGMGSGVDANSISSVSLSLIESFYKAGMNSKLILSTVNNLLSVNTEDSFTALDVTVINLKEKTADFIKYGAPYGFIINDGAVKIVEGNTLPLGILEELSPSVAQTKINDGDMILLLTDGISDAFGSSSEVIDFLRTIPAKNPQVLTNQILSKAIALSNGNHFDDMTALAVRIFKH